MTTNESKHSPSSQTAPTESAMQPVYLVQGNNNKAVDDEIDLRELWDALWQGKLHIVALTSVFAVI